MFKNIRVVYPDNAEAFVTCDLCSCDTDHETLHDEGVMLSDRDDVEDNALHYNTCPIMKYREGVEVYEKKEFVESYQFNRFTYA